MSTILSVKDLTKTYRLGNKHVAALRGVNLSIATGSTFAVIGESGCGKSTLGKLAVRLEEPTSGAVYFQQQPLHNLNHKAMLHVRRRLQIVFQDSYASLNPRMCIEDIVSEGLVIHGDLSRAARRDKVADMLAQVGLPSSVLSRYPHEFSGGQRQRINIARALVLDPLFLVCDEPLSALDVSVQAQVMQLLASLKQQRQLTYLFISHDLRAVQALADIVAVMYLGQIVEQAPADQLFRAPKHPYTQALVATTSQHHPMHTPKRTSVPIHGEPPSPLAVPTGCPFHPRCPRATSACRQLAPALKEVADNHLAACHLL